jgi:hypothetical protein
VIEQRRLWKEYLRAHHLAPAALLRDAVHLNTHGEFLMAELAKAYLVRDPAHDGMIPGSGTIDDLPLDWKDGKARVEWTGNRVDLAPGAAWDRALRVLIDGRPPSAWPELFAVTRTSAVPHTDWPAIKRVEAEAPWIEETWTARVTDITPDGKSFRFSVEGSVTGPDGEGKSGERFVSRSRRVAIDPGVWTMEYAFKVSQQPVEAFEVTWLVVPLFQDRIAPAPAGGADGRLAWGLPAGRHVLELEAEAGSTVLPRAVRVHAPPLRRD